MESLRLGKIAAPEVRQQAAAYGDLLLFVSTQVSADEARRLLLRPILQVGIASIGGATGCDPVAVVCPWHPMRMYLTAARLNALQGYDRRSARRVVGVVLGRQW